MIKVCMVGIGRTGKEIIKSLLGQEGIKVVSAMCSPDSAKINKDLGDIIGCAQTGIIIKSIEDLEQVVFTSRPDVVVDFSNAAATLKNAELFSRMKINMVIGTTGFSDSEIESLAKLTRKYHNGIVYAPNITLGVNVSMLLANIAASILNNYDFHINEIHHKLKKDSPSGTALKISKEIEKGLNSAGVSLKEEIPITSIRCGGIIGKHEIFIVGENDKIEITHESITRKAFAEGTIYATKFIWKKIGFFEMSDVLNLKQVLMDYIENQEHLIKV